jgi:TonB family protein
MDPQLMFAPLARPHSRWKSLLIGWGVQAQFVVALLVLNAIAPQPMQQAKKYVMTNLVAPAEPVIKEAKPVTPRLSTRPTPQAVVTTPTVARLVVPHQMRSIKESELDVTAPEIKVVSKTPVFSALPGVPASKVVATNTFTTPTSVPPTTIKAAAQVQTGGFGDPNGIAAIEGGKHSANIAAKGNPGLPIGSGFGNGLGGSAKGLPGVGIVGQGVQSSGFDTHTAPGPKQPLIVANELGSPVEIVEKPKPSYTEEGRKHGVEGEVRLEVQFTADGHVRVLRVLQRLGFGLDEQALHCAERIRFKPATHGGQPIDSIAVVHIVFELAS